MLPLYVLLLLILPPLYFLSPLSHSRYSQTRPRTLPRILYCAPLWSPASRLLLHAFFHIVFTLILLVFKSDHIICHPRSFRAFPRHMSPVPQLLRVPKVGEDIPQKTVLLCTWCCLSKVSLRKISGT